MTQGMTHGMSYTSTYTSWAAMCARCKAKEGDKRYKYYAGRGITVCERWNKFENFYADMGERPAGHTLDRIDNDKGYFKENCRWATRREQVNNRSCNILVEFREGQYTLEELAALAKKPLSIIKMRHWLGWDGEKIVTTPVKTKVRSFLYEGETLTVKQLAERTGISAVTIRSRAGRGWTVDEIVNTPIRKDRRYHE